MKKLLKNLTVSCFASSLMTSGISASELYDHPQSLTYNSTINYLSELSEAQKSFDDKKKVWELKSEKLEKLPERTQEKLVRIFSMSSEEAKTAAFAYAQKIYIGYAETLKKLESELQAQEEKRNIEGHKILSNDYFPSNEITFLGKVVIGHGHRLYIEALQSRHRVKKSTLETCLEINKGNMESAQRDLDIKTKHFISSYALLTPENMARVEKAAEMQGTKIKK